MNEVVSFDIPIISKEEAKEKGLNKFFTGEECDHGHIDFRYTRDERCKSCQKNSSDKWNKKNPNARLIANRKTGATYRKNHPERHRKKNALWKKNNPAYIAFMAGGAREKIKTKLTRAERDQAIAVYSQRIIINSLFEGNLVEVDHIMPLSKGGKHHPKNLQILSIDENNQKWNRFRPKDQLLWLENYFGDLPATKARKKRFKTLKLNVKNV